VIDEDERVYHFTLGMRDCKLISLAMGMLERAAYNGGDIPGYDAAHSLFLRFSPRTLKEQAERT
jgi:hypothetical protein